MSFFTCVAEYGTFIPGLLPPTGGEEVVTEGLEGVLEGASIVPLPALALSGESRNFLL